LSSYNRLAQALTVSKACGFCGGSGIHPEYSRVPCPRCRPWRSARKSDNPDDPDQQEPDEDDKIACPNCAGDGKDADGGTCQRCDGEGRIANPNQPDDDDDDENVQEKKMLEALTEWDRAVSRRMRSTGETLATASLNVGREHPDLYAAVCEESDEAATTVKRRRKYLEALHTRFQARGHGTTQHVFTSTLPMR
jgi:RecJ-like exonuclease